MKWRRRGEEEDAGCQGCHTGNQRLPPTCHELTTSASPKELSQCKGARSMSAKVHVGCKSAGTRNLKSKRNKYSLKGTSHAHMHPQFELRNSNLGLAQGHLPNTMALSLFYLFQPVLPLFRVFPPKHDANTPCTHTKVHEMILDTMQYQGLSAIHNIQQEKGKAKTFTRSTEHNQHQGDSFLGAHIIYHNTQHIYSQ